MSIAVTLVKSTLRATSVVAPNLAGKWAFALFCRVGRAKVRPAEAQLHGQAHVENLEFQGRRVVTYRWGDGGSPVLLVHGWESRGSRYAAVVAELLERGFSPVTFDAPANGDSEGDRTTILEYVEVIKQLSERHGPFRAIVAHSFGVLAAFHALRAGVQADRVVTISGVCDFRYLVDSFSGALGLQPRIRDDVARRMEGLFPADARIWERYSVPFRAAEMTAPVLVIQDEDDDRVGVDQAKRIADSFAPRSRLVLTRGLGHRRVLGDPEVLRLVGDFVAGKADASADAPPTHR